MKSKQHFEFFAKYIFFPNYIIITSGIRILDVMGTQWNANQLNYKVFGNTNIVDYIYIGFTNYTL